MLRFFLFITKNSIIFVLTKHMDMTTTNYTIRIENEKFGKLLHETFVDAIQFKLFLKMVQGCLELKNDLTFFNGSDFLIHVPHKYLVDSVIVTSTFDMSLADHMRSKVEALVTK